MNKQRNHAIYLKHLEEGISYSDLGRKYGVSRERIKQIVEREKIKLKQGPIYALSSWVKKVMADFCSVSVVDLDMDLISKKFGNKILCRRSFFKMHGCREKVYNTIIAFLKNHQIPFKEKT